MTTREREELVRLCGQLADDLAVVLRDLAETTAEVARLHAGAKHLGHLARALAPEPDPADEETTGRDEPEFDRCPKDIES
jgi:hypothetical protein